MAKKDLQAAVAAAAKAADHALERADRAAEVVERRPTAFTYATMAEAPQQGNSHVVDAPQAIQIHGDTGQGNPYHVVVPISEIDENPFNARRIYRQERVEKLAVSLAGQGQIVPGIATIRNGRYQLVAGHYRLRSIRFAGLKAMGLMVYDSLTDRQLYELSLKENAERDDQSAFDNALAWRDLLEKEIYPNAEALTEVVGMSRANVSKTLSILDLSDGILEIVKQDPASFPLSSLYELVRLEKVAGSVVAMDVVSKLLTGDITRGDISALRERHENPQTRKKRESSRQHYRILSGAKEIGAIKDFDDGRVMLQVTVEDVKEREALVELLRSHFKLD